MKTSVRSTVFAVIVIASIGVLTATTLVEASRDFHGTYAWTGASSCPFKPGFRRIELASPRAARGQHVPRPQSIDPSGSVAGQVTVLAVTSIVIELFVLAGYGTLAGRITGRAIQRRFARLTNRVAGSLLVTAGVGVAALRRS